MVYVQDMSGQALMPTKRHGKVRRLLHEGCAKVVNRCPFTIKLLYESTTYTQNVTLGIDAGSKTMGLSATTKDTALFEAEVAIRNDITDLLSARRELRKARRNRKTRYRKPKFLNRTRSKHKGWLAPSVEAKIGSHIEVAKRVCAILPVTKIVIEVASFDTQAIKAEAEGRPLPEGTDYQQGEMLGFWNTREYVLWRDGHMCQYCKGKSKDPILNVHHIESRRTGGNAPNNLITLCETCYKRYHRGEVKLPDTIRRGVKLDDAAFMDIMRWTAYNRLKETFEPGIEVKLTYGYITKNTRIHTRIEKTHMADARCISGNPKAMPTEETYLYKKTRRHNRQIHKLTINKGGARKANQAPYEVKSFRLNDIVLYEGRTWYVHGRRTKGAFVLKTLSGETIERSPSKLKRLMGTNCYIVERRSGVAF